VAGLAAAFGSGAMTNTIGDVEQADAILVTGSNTTENHPVLSTFVKRAVKFKGCKLIVVDPRRIKLTTMATKWLRPNLGCDVAWINGLMNVIISEDLYDKEFIENRTEQFDALKEMVSKFTPDFVEDITNIPAQEIIAAARIYANAKAAAILYCMGITQHISGTDNVKSLANLAMLCGNLGIKGGGVNPLRGQNNVQGACDMGGLPNVFTAYQPVADKGANEKHVKAWSVSELSTKPGMTATEMLPAALEGKLKSLYIIGENPLVSDPDLNHAKKCIENLEFLVVQDIFMTETTQMADVIFPSACFAEKDGTFSNTERKVQRIRKAVNPPGIVRTDWEITCGIASRMGYKMEYKDAEEIMKEIASVTPSYGGINYKRIEFEGLHWPCPTVDHPGTPILHTQTFPRGKGLFHAIDYIPPAEQIDKEYPLYLTTGRLLYHYHTGTMTMKSDGLNERAPECYVEISRVDANKMELQDRSQVAISSRRGSITAKVNISDKTAPGVIFIPFHFADSAANKLTNAVLDPISKIPEFKVCAVKLEKT